MAPNFYILDDAGKAAIQARKRRFQAQIEADLAQIHKDGLDLPPTDLEQREIAHRRDLHLQEITQILSTRHSNQRRTHA